MRAVAEAAPRASVDAKVTVMPREGFPATSGEVSTSAGEARDHVVRIVLFERSSLIPSEEEAIRRAITAEIGLNPNAGDQLSFSPAPQMAAAVPTALPSTPAKLPVESRQAAQDRFMASLAHAWMVALLLLGAGALAVLALSLRRLQIGRRQALIQRIRDHLLLPAGLADAS
jgi:hypothetical protein